MILRLYLDRSYDLIILSKGFNFNSVCGEAGKHAVSSVNVQVRPFKDGVNIANKVINFDGLIKAEIIDSSALFTGVIRPYLNTSSMNAYAENLSLEIMDNTETMHIYVYDPSVDGVIEGRIYPSVKKNILIRDLVEWLFSLCNLSVDVSSIPDDETVPYFKLSAGVYIDEVIERFLYEYGYDYKFDSTGKAVIFHTYLDDVSIKGEIKDAINSISLSRSDDTLDGLNVTYKKYSYAANKRILNFYTGNMKFDDWGLFADDLEGKLYSGFMHDKRFNPNSSMPDGNLWNWNFENCGVMIDDERKLTASDVLFVDTDISRCKVNLYDENDVDYSLVLDSYDENGCRLWVDYNGRFNVNPDFTNGWLGWTWRIEVYGNIGYAMSEDFSYSIDGPNPETFRFEYLMVQSSDNIKENLVKKYYNRQKLSKVTYEFQSLSEYEIGDFYTLVDPVSGRSQDVRLISRKKGSDNIYTYRAEGAGKIEDHPVEIKNESKSYSASTSNGMSAYEIAVENGFQGTEEEWQESLSAKDFSVVFSPAVYNIEPRKGGTSTITCTISRINNLAGNVSASIYSGASGFTLSADGDTITITYANNVSTSTSFKIDIRVGDITKTYALNGMMKDVAPKNLGWFEVLPDESTAPEKFIEGDCVLIQGVPYRYADNTWTQLDNINSLDISMAMSLVDTAMSHVNVEEQSMSVVYGFIKNLFSQNAIIDFIKTRIIEMQSGGIIKSEGYTPGENKKGFYLSSDGTFECYDGTFKGTLDGAKGRFTGQLETITLKTVLGGKSSYSVGNFSTASSMTSSLYTVQNNLGFDITNKLFKAGGTLSGLGTIASMNVSQVYNEFRNKIYTYKPFLGSKQYKWETARITWLVITFTNTSGSTVQYVIRKVRREINWTGENTSPDYPSIPQITSIPQILDQDDYVIKDYAFSQPPGINDPDNKESVWDSVGLARKESLSVSGLVVYDNTQERMYIENLPTAAPSEPNRIWRDSNGYLRIV